MKLGRLECTLSQHSVRGGGGRERDQRECVYESVCVCVWMRVCVCTYECGIIPIVDMGICVPIA